MESIFSDLLARMEGAIAEAAALAADARMPESTSGLILAGVSKRAGMFEWSDDAFMKYKTVNNAAT